MNEPLAVKGSEREWSRAQVCEVLRRVIMDETGVRDFTEDSHFIKDMGIN